MNYAKQTQHLRHPGKALAPFCVVCENSIRHDQGRCTNGCCSECHKRFCTPGGVTSPGHGINIEGARAKVNHAQSAA